MVHALHTWASVRGQLNSGVKSFVSLCNSQKGFKQMLDYSRDLALEFLSSGSGGLHSQVVLNAWTKFKKIWHCGSSHFACPSLERPLLLTLRDGFRQMGDNMSRHVLQCTVINVTIYLFIRSRHTDCTMQDTNNTMYSEQIWGYRNDQLRSLNLACALVLCPKSQLFESDLYSVVFLF